MFKWPTPPTDSAPRHELADFIELFCWQQGNTSATDLSRLLGRLAENDYSDGVPEEEEMDWRIEDAFREIERRQEVCSGGYPFEFVNGEHTIRVTNNHSEPVQYIYKYLLLCTRLNMASSRLHVGIDGTQLFEELSAQVARTYFGERAKSIVFGTAAGGTGFREKVDSLCLSLGEGDGFADRPTRRRRARDGKLDVVVWKPFADGLAGKLIGFGQCKTGTHYKDSLTELQPEGFIKKWIRESMIVPPLRMFFISEALATTSSERFEDSVDAGLLFDRCRIVDFCDGVDEEVMATVREWTTAAATANGLPSP